MFHFRIGHLDDAEELIKRFHYSRRVPTHVVLCGTWHRPGGLFGDFGEAIAACVFRVPPTRWSEEVLELARLVRHEDDCPPLTALIAACCDELRRRKCDLVISYADPTHEHHGGVYQASSWHFAGRREPTNDGILLDGHFIAGRACNNKWGTRSVEKVRELEPSRDIQPHFDAGKYLYWRALTKTGKRKAATLGLESLAYPKPANTR
jgi:hypothetical protein